MFEWGPLFSWSAERTVYRLRGTEVARLTEKVGGGWTAIVNQHRPSFDPKRVKRDCKSFETGKAGVEQWAEKRRERLEREIAEIDAARPCRPWMPAGQKDQPR